MMRRIRRYVGRSSDRVIPGSAAQPNVVNDSMPSKASDDGADVSDCSDKPLKRHFRRCGRSNRVLPSSAVEPVDHVPAPEKVPIDCAPVNDSSAAKSSRWPWPHIRNVQAVVEA